MSDHDAWRDMTAAYVLGALDVEERAAFEAHLSTCGRCRDEVLSMAPIPALLGRVDPEEIDDHRPGDDVDGAAADAVVEAVRADVRRIERSRRRWRSMTGIAAACLALAGASVLLLDEESSTRPDDGVALAIGAESAASGEIVAEERPWGTYLHLSLRELPPRDGYELWVVDSAGGWSLAGTWGPTPDGTAALGGSSELPLADIEQVVVTSTGRGDELLVAS